MEEKKSGVFISRDALRSLIAGASGDAALLYLARLAAVDCPEAKLPGFTPARAAAAQAALETLGLAEKAELKVQPDSAANAQSFTMDDITAELERKGEFSYLVSETERRLGTRLSTANLTILMNIYANLGLPTEVLYLLLTYCVEDVDRFYGAGRKPTVRQIESEAYRWARMGLDSIDKALDFIDRKKEALSKLGTIRKVLGIDTRKAARSEETYILKWVDWGFGPEAVELAYDKTVFKTGELSWKYLNSILKNWHEKGLHTLDEINEGDTKPFKEENYGPDSDYEQAAIEWAKNYRRSKNRGEPGGPDYGNGRNSSW
ncbi:MAG: DnaD domain protein [Oscillospiraceae bacterium]|nr:DnaD domain protein [Oscillospiraceae bacterium]